jgi:hypothetical protein
MLGERETDDAPRTHVQHRRQMQPALVGRDLGAVAVPLLIPVLAGTPARSGPVPATDLFPGRVVCRRRH